MNGKCWLTLDNRPLGCAKRMTRVKGEHRLPQKRTNWTIRTGQGWGTRMDNEGKERAIPHPTNGMIFLDIHGGPLHEKCMPFIPTLRYFRPPNKCTQDILIDGQRAIYVFNPVNDRWECRYEEEV